MMRLVIDGRRLTAERTGVGRYLEMLLRDWAVSGSPLPETLVVLRDRAGLTRVPYGSGILAEVAGEGWPGLIWERWALGRKLRAGDVLFAPTNLIPANWRGKSVLVMHDTLLESLPDAFPWHVRWRFARRYRRAAQRADRILTPSESTARDVAAHYGIAPARMRVIHPAADTSFRPQGPASEEVTEARARVGLGTSPFFLFVGKTSSRRNVPAILEAFRRHSQAHPEHRLVFVGPSEIDLGRLEDDRAILRPGHVAEPVLRGLMADAIALLYPSEYEGFGLPIVEAMASGCPVITIRRGAMLEAGGDAAWFIDRAEPGELARAMEILATSVSARACRISRGFAQADRFDPSRFADRVKAEIRDVAGYRPALRGPKGRSASRRRVDRQP